MPAHITVSSIWTPSVVVDYYCICSLSPCASKHSTASFWAREMTTWPLMIMWCTRQPLVWFYKDGKRLQVVWNPGSLFCDSILVTGSTSEFWQCEGRRAVAAWGRLSARLVRSKVISSTPSTTTDSNFHSKPQWITSPHAPVRNSNSAQGVTPHTGSCEGRRGMLREGPLQECKRRDWGRVWVWVWKWLKLIIQMHETHTIKI